MSCNNSISLGAVADEVTDLLGEDFIRKEDPKITGGVLTDTTLRGTILLNEQAKLSFCGHVDDCVDGKYVRADSPTIRNVTLYNPTVRGLILDSDAKDAVVAAVKEVGLPAPEGKEWLPYPNLDAHIPMSYASGIDGINNIRWTLASKVVNDVAGGRLDALRTDTDRNTQQAAINKAGVAENLFGISTLINTTDVLTAEADATSETHTRDVAQLQAQIDAIGGGSVPYATFEAMELDKGNITTKMVLEVTNDPDTAKNGRYSYDGVTFVKSAYDPVTQSRQYTDAEILELQTNLTLDLATQRERNEDFRGTPVEYDSPNAAYVTPTGVTVPSSDWVTSNKIAVKKGDIFILRGEGVPADILSASGINIFSLYTTSNIFAGALHCSRAAYADLADEQLVRDLNIGDYFSTRDYFNYTTIIPEDGFLTVTTSTTLLSYVNLGTAKAKPTLHKIDYNQYLKIAVKYSEEHSLSSFGGVLHSVLTDKNIPDNGKLSYTAKPVPVEGGPPVYRIEITSGRSAVSKRYAIRKGQYIHYSLYQYNDTTCLYFEDEEGNFLGTQNIITEYTTGGDKSGKAAFNIESQYDGYFRLVYLNHRNSTPLVGVTENYVAYSRAEVQPNANNIKFYPLLGKVNTTAGDVHNPSSYALSFPFTNRGNPTVSNTISRPYFLPRGRVLRYELSSTASPLMLAVVRADQQLTAQGLQSRALYNATYLPVIDTRVYTEEHRAAWLARDPLTNTKQFLRPGRPGRVDYCNEDEDTLVMFLRPPSGFVQFKELGLTEGYRIKTFSKEEYKVLRAGELAQAFRGTTGYGVSGSANNISLTGGIAVHKGLSSYPPVLLFKGEVLNYATNFLAKSAVRNLRVALGEKQRGEVYHDLSFSYGWTGSTDENFVPLWNRQITLEDKLSYHYNQILAIDTCIVFPGVSTKAIDGVTDIDEDRLIADQYFSPRIVDIADLVIGGNVEPLFVPLFTQAISYTKDPDTGAQLTSSLVTSMSPHVDYIISFTPGSSYINYTMWSHHNTINLWKNKVTGVASTRPFPANGWEPDLYKDEDGGWGLQAGQNSLVSMGTYIAEDSIILLNSKTAVRDVALAIGGYNTAEIDRVIDTTVNPKQMEEYKHELRHITAGTFHDEYAVTDKQFLNIPIDSGITFDLRTMSSVSLEKSLWGVLQIRSGDRVLAVLNVKTENQGQSSANYDRKNVNLEFYNSRFEEVFVSFGGYIAQEEVVLKSYERSDRGQWRESTANRLWYKVRNAKPRPYGGVFPFDVYNDPNKPTNQKARGTTYAIPVEFHRGGEFWGVFSIRNKKKRENYCMEKSNKNHILIQADRTLMPFSWTNLEMGMFEVRNPSIKGYTEGDKVLPIGNEDTQAKINRLLDWLRACYRGTTDITTTYKEYIDLDSFIDYCMVMQYVYNWDGTRNNFLLGSFDGVIWHIYQYDTDHTFGGYSEVYSKPFSPFAFDVDARGDIFNQVIIPSFPDKVLNRYTMLRDKGIFDTKNIQAMIDECNNMVNAYARKKDLEYWGPYAPAQDVASGMWWTAQRINFLDANYGYDGDDANLVVNELFNPSSLAPGAAESFQYVSGDVAPTDVLMPITGENYDGFSLTAEYTAPNLVTVTVTNNGETEVNLGRSYIRVYREV